MEKVLLTDTLKMEIKGSLLTIPDIDKHFHCNYKKETNRK